MPIESRSAADSAVDFTDVSGGWRATSALLVVLTGLAVWFYHDTIWLGPAHHHSWAQADWFAIAYRFRTDGFDFFHPATFNLMTPDGRTPAGFPLPPYLAAILMALTGSSAPGLMRLLTLALSTAGLLALAALVRRAALASGTATGIKAAVRGALAALLMACSPMYVYYQAGFQPTVPALAAALGGYYCFGRARWATTQPAARRWLAGAVGLLALAGAIRTPLALPWAMVAVHLVLEGRRTARRYGAAWMLGLYGLTGAWLVGYFLYNEALARQLGGAMFLARPLPPTSLAELGATWDAAVPKWRLALLSGGQWLALAALVVALIATMIVQRLSAARWYAWLLHGAGLLVGGLLYAALMSVQLFDHDYYFLDALLLPLVLTGSAALALVKLPEEFPRATLAVGAMALLIWWTMAARAEQVRRYTTAPGDRNELTRANFQRAAAWLDSLGVAPAAQVVVLDAYSYNLPLLLANRHGWTVLTTSEEAISAGLAQPAQYVITQDTFFRSDAVAGYPLLTERLARVAGNGRLTLWRPRPLPTPILTARTDLEAPLDSAHWQNGATRVSVPGGAHSGQMASALLPHTAYSVGLVGAMGALGLRGGEHLLARCFVWLPPNAPEPEVKLVVSVEDAAGTTYSWQGYGLARVSHGSGRWNALGAAFTLPVPRAPTDVLRVYVLKNGPAPAYADDFDLTFVRR